MADGTNPGHRQRLKESFMAADDMALTDEALLELLLTYSIPQKDVQPLAKNLISEFGSLESVLAADPDTLCQFKGVQFHSSTLLKLVHAIRMRSNPMVSAEMISKSESRKAPTTLFDTINVTESQNQEPPIVEEKKTKPGESVVHRRGTGLFSKALLKETMALLPQLPETESLAEVREFVRKNLFENQPPNLFGTHEIVRWYLTEMEVDKVDAAESAKEDAAAKSVEGFIAKRLKERPGEEGVHYSDIFEQYVYVVKDKPRRLLQDWLLDYFYRTPAGTYRLPSSDEEIEAKEYGRAAGTNRRIKRYVAYLEQGIAVPDKERPGDSTIVEWIRHCKRAGLYEQGRLLYEKGGLSLDNLPEEAMVNVEEDYQVCVRMLARSGDGKQAKKGK